MNKQIWTIGDRYQIIENDVILTGEIVDVTHDFLVGFQYHVEWNDGQATIESKHSIDPMRNGSRRFA